MMILVRSALMAALVLIASACERSPTGSRTRAENIVSFDYAGVRTGSFRATGLPPEDGRIGGSFAVAYSRPADRGILLYAFVTTAAPRGDLVILRIPEKPGTYGLDCGAAGPDTCAYAEGTFNTDPAGTGYEQGRVDMVTVGGVVTVTQVTETRVRGVFSGPAIIYVPPSNVPAGNLSITNGRFDVQRRAQPAGLQRSPLAARGHR
jgi:hypothetical protein